MKNDRELWRFITLRLVKYLKNIVEQDHRQIKRLGQPGLGFRSFRTACRTIAGSEIMAMVRRGQVAAIPANDMPAQATFIRNLFGIVASRRGSPRLLLHFTTEPARAGKPPATI